MIRHLPEGIFPFEDCGYARHPLYPMAGQAIHLDCLCDGGAPALEIAGEACAARPLPTAKGWRFTLPARERACEVRYRFVRGEESTRWFAMDVLTPVTVDAPLRTGEGWAELCPGVYLRGREEEGGRSLTLTCCPPEDAPCGPITFGEGCVWRMRLPEGRSLACVRMTLGLRADGAPAWQEMELAGAHGHVYGTGERFDAVDQQGRGSCGRVVEHFTRQGEWSYLPTPFFMTDGGFGLYRATGYSVAMAFGEMIRVASPVDDGLTDHWLTGTPDRQLRAYVRLTGGAALPPEWAFGLWISANGWKCDADVDEQLRALKEHDCPASVMVLEAWSDESTFYRWSDQWADPAAMVRRVREAGLHLVLWQIPVLKALRDCPDPEPVRRDREEAVARGYVVRNADGSPYVIPEKWFEGSLLPDFTNPEAAAWWFSRREHLLEAGVEGFKTDGGEFLFGDDVLLHDGTSGRAAHNLYPLQYTGAYHRWMRDRGLPGLTFSRAGYAGAQCAPIHWAGDQLSRWSELRAQLTAGLTAGLSGILFWSFDMGGFAGPLPDGELYLRATAMGCFCPVMQWHAEPRSGQFDATEDASLNNDRSPWNLARYWQDPSIAETACAFARLREKLRPVLWEEAQRCVRDGRPMMAHLCLDYPGDGRALACDDEYMLGRRYLVAPVTEPGAAGRRVYLPRGQWRHFFTGETLAGGEYDLPCPLDQALVFERVEA
ncbi:MAG: TIM-barrel domain-containing protein [Aristaeellaceae bacterium]